MLGLGGIGPRKYATGLFPFYAGYKWSTGDRDLWRLNLGNLWCGSVIYSALFTPSILPLFLQMSSSKLLRAVHDNIFFSLMLCYSLLISSYYIQIIFQILKERKYSRWLQSLDFILYGTRVFGLNRFI